MGLNMGVIDCVVNVAVIRLYGRDVSPFLQVGCCDRRLMTVDCLLVTLAFVVTCPFIQFIEYVWPHGCCCCCC